MSNTTFSASSHAQRFTGQYGGGKNCDCREAYFNPDELIRDPRISSLVSESEIREKIDAASGIVRSGTKFVVLVFVFWMIAVQVATIPFRMLQSAFSTCNTNNICNATETSSYCPENACNFYCCPIEHYEYEDARGASSLEGAGCTANFTERKWYSENGRNEVTEADDKNLCWCNHEHDHDNESEDDDYERHDRLLKARKKRKGKSSNVEGKCKGRVLMSGNVTRNPGNQWLLALAIPLIITAFFLPFGLIIWKIRNNSKKMKELFQVWEAKQIYTTFIRGTKHSPAWLCFDIKGQNLQQLQHTIVGNQGDIRMVQPYQKEAMLQQGGIMMMQQQPSLVQGQVVMVHQQPSQVPVTVVQQSNVSQGMSQFQNQQQGLVVQPIQQYQVQQPNRMEGMSQYQNQQQGLAVQPIQQNQVRPVITNQTSNANVVHKI